MNENVDTIAAWLMEQQGCPYIYGGTGQSCTPDYRRARMAQYPQYTDLITKNCQQLRDKDCKTCRGCRWAIDGVGRLAYDCAQQVRLAMQQIGIALVSGANSQWLKTAFVIKGDIKDIPRNMLCIVYRKDADGTMHHTGMYMGDGTVIHAKGHNYGVVREALEKIDKPLTHYGIPAGLYSNKELREAGITPGLNLPTLRRGSKGEQVQIVQQLLNEVVGAGLTVDGAFGAKTEEALKEYQKRHKLTSDGVCGPKTWAELGFVPEDDEGEKDMPDEPVIDDDTIAVSRALLTQIGENLKALADRLVELAGGK